MATVDRSTTAEYATMFRAAHLYYDGQPKLFEDPIAFDILEPPFRVFLKFRIAFRAVQAVWPLRPARAQILIRSRYAEDRLDEAIEEGVRQYVILGAGFDTYSVRRPPIYPPLEIFELDLEENQKVKQAKLGRLGHEKGEHLHYVPIDFEWGAAVNDVLPKEGFDPESAAFFSCLGVVHYLPKEAVLRTLGQIADCAASGSQLVLDYKLADRALSGRGAKVRSQVELATKTRGEPMHSTFTASELAALARRLGWNVEEDVPPEAQRERYLAGRSDGLTVFEDFSLARLRRV